MVIFHSYVNVYQRVSRIVVPRKCELELDGTGWICQLFCAGLKLRGPRAQRCSMA
jgi:hypothetical protein